MAEEVSAQQEPNGANGSIMPPPAASTNGVLATADMPINTTTNLSADEIALYDRQIRLWGAQAQEYIRSAHVLLVSLRALGTEIAKNLTLAGISSLTIVDDSIVTEEDLGAQYFLREEDVGKPRAEAAIPRIQSLNPRVTVKSDGSLANLLSQDQTYYQPFSCVIACDHDFMTLATINTASRFAARPFYAAGIHGFYGFIFADLFCHQFVVERDKSNIPTQPNVRETGTRSIMSVTDKDEKPVDGKKKEIVKKQEVYCPLILANSSPLPQDILTSRRKLKQVPALLPCLRALFDFQRKTGRLPSQASQDLAAFTTLATSKSRELMLPPEILRAEFLRSFIQNIGAEIVPTAAFVGGRLSEDVINVLSKREQPIQNFALFDGDSLDGRIYCLYSDPPELTLGLAGMAGDMGMGMGMDVGMGGDMGMGMGMENGVGFMQGNMPMDGSAAFMPMGMVMGGGSGMLMGDQSLPLGNSGDGNVAGGNEMVTNAAGDATAAPVAPDTADGATNAPASEGEAAGQE